ncbi:MAG TPA: hypothetical protein VK661_01375 [Planctomycetota bacterium]|nr:hypothetical protein [Planctomycetota bacterium]
MIPGLPGLLLAVLMSQESVPKFIPGETSETTWAISAPAEVEDKTELTLRARRVERRWDRNVTRFVEFQSEDTQMHAVVEVTRKWLDTSLKPGPVGRYQLSLATDETLLYSDRVALGGTEALFTRSIDSLKKILEVGVKAGAFLDEIEKLVANPRDATAKAKEDFLKRVAEQIRDLNDLYMATDLTGTIGVLRLVFHHLMNVQIWNAGKAAGPAQNDPIVVRKKLFVQPDLTIAELRKMLAAIPEILSAEIKVSTTLIVERLIAQARNDDRRREAARAAARAASKLAEAAPVQDPALGPVLDKAASPTTDPDEVRVQLRVVAQPHLVP